MEDEVVDSKRKEQRELRIAERRHEEQMSTLKGIAALLNKPEKEDKAIIDAINKQGAAIEKVAAAIQNQPKPEKPEVNVELNNAEVVNLLKEVKEGQKELKQYFETRPLVDEFIISPHGWNGTEKKAKVIYKPMNQVTIKK